MPLYISNYCENNCVYCGFQAGLDIPRQKLTLEEIAAECQKLKDTGIQNLLLLTGESRTKSSPEYIKEAVIIAKKYCPNIGLEIYPLETAEYKELFIAGADAVTIYQETYDRERYDQLHLSGKKKDYDYRYYAPERIAQAGFRQISLGALLGISDWRADVISLYEHLSYLEKTYPGVEYSLSFPRLQKIDNQEYTLVNDAEMLKILALTRILFPRVGINLSTRETAEFRDVAIDVSVTKVSGGSLTSVGGYANQTKSTGQFSINDERSLAEVKQMLINKGYDPVITDWRNI